jgi:hypothetical protein
MTDEHRAWPRQGADFWRAHHEAWKRSDLNQRQYFEAEGIPLKAFGNWRAQFKAEPQPPERKLLYRRRRLSHPLSPPVSHHLSHPFSAVTYPSRGWKVPSFHGRGRASTAWIGETARRRQLHPNKRTRPNQVGRSHMG